MAVNVHQLERWLHRIGQGDRDALARLYREAGTGIYAYALSLLKNRHDAQDVLQDTFLAVWNSAGSYRPQGKPMAWLMTIARNLCYKQLNRAQRLLPLEEGEICTAPGLDPEEALLLQSCMQRLTQEERQIVVLHAVAGWKHRQIGDFLALPLSTVLSKYHRALQKLRAHYD